MEANNNLPIKVAAVLPNAIDAGDGELVRESTSSILELLRKEGSRIVKRQVELFNLDVIISVGYRVATAIGHQQT